jgi:hypothetical protein
MRPTPFVSGRRGPCVHSPRRPIIELSQDSVNESSHCEEHRNANDAIAGCIAGPLPSAFSAEDDGGYIFENNERKPEEMKPARAKIPAVTVELPASRLQRLPETMKRLRDGGTLRIVMLGDSIINDTARSCWHELLKEHYPKCRTVRVVSVRGGTTGCWFYAAIHGFWAKWGARTTGGLSGSRM